MLFYLNYKDCFLNLITQSNEVRSSWNFKGNFILGWQGDILHQRWPHPSGLPQAGHLRHEYPNFLTHLNFTTNESDLHKTFRITSFLSIKMIYDVRDEPIQVSRPPQMGHLIHEYPNFIHTPISQANEAISSWNFPDNLI